MTLASRVAARLPERLLVMLVSLAYRRFEPEIRRLDEVCGRGGTMVDIGGWYGPWTRRRDQPRLLVEVEQRIQPVTDVIGLLESWGYRGWVRPGRRWVPVADFPLAAHHASTCHVSERGLLARAL